MSADRRLHKTKKQPYESDNENQDYQVHEAIYAPVDDADLDDGVGNGGRRIIH